MSHSYLRHSRRPSQRISPPPSPNSISSLINPTGQFAQQLFTTQILANTPPGNTDPEPLPSLDYHLLYLLINLARPYLPKRTLKRYDYLADARKWYLVNHSQFTTAYTGLLDASSYGKILDTRFDALLNTAKEKKVVGPEAQQIMKELAQIEISRRKNNEDLRWNLLEVGHRATARDTACLWLSSLKWKCLQHDVPELISMAKQIYAQQMAKNGPHPPTDNSTPIINLTQPTSNLPRINDEGKGETSTNVEMVGTNTNIVDVSTERNLWIE